MEPLSGGSWRKGPSATPGAGFDMAATVCQAPSGRLERSHPVRQAALPWTTALFPALDVITGRVMAGHYCRRRRESLDSTDESVAADPSREIHVVLVLAKIKEAVYQYSRERRWGAAVLVSGLFLLSRGKKHWFTLVQGVDKPEEAVFQLHKANFSGIPEAFEKASRQKVRMQAGRQ